jgi:hypothetical protein
MAWAADWGATPAVTGVTDHAQNKYAEAGSTRSTDSANDRVDSWFAKNSGAGSNSQSATTSPAAAPVTTTTPGDPLIAVATPAPPIKGIYPGNPFTDDSLPYEVGWAHLIISTAGSGFYAGSTVPFRIKGSSGLSPCDLQKFTKEL